MLNVAKFQIMSNLRVSETGEFDARADRDGGRTPLRMLLLFACEKTNTMRSTSRGNNTCEKME